MEMIKRYAGILMMLTLLVGFTSCEDDEGLSCNSWGIKFSQFPSCIYLC